MQSRLSKQRIPFKRVFVVAMILTVAAGWALTNFLGNVADTIFKEGVGREASLIVAILNDYLDRVENATKALSQADSMVAALSPGGLADREHANRLLDHYKSSMEMSVCYLLDGNGTAVASSNRNDASGFVGKSFAFRPYFKGALAGRLTQYFALGSYTNKRGYFAAAPLVGRSNTVRGAVVIKRDIAPIEEAFRKYPNAFLVSPEGIIFITSRKELLFRPLWPVAQSRRAELLATGQFGNIAAEPVLAAEPRTGTYVRLYRSDLYLQRLPIGHGGWTLVLMEQPRIVSSYRLFGILLTIFFAVLLLLFIVVLRYKDTSLAAAGELLRAKDVWKRTLDAVPDLIATVDSNQCILSINRAMARRLGLSQEEAVGRRCHELVPGPQQLPPVCPRCSLPDSGEAEPEFRFEKYLEGDFIVTTAPILAENGGTESVVHVMHEVSDLKRMEQSLKEYAQRLELALEGANDATWEWDVIADRGFINTRYYEMTGNTPGETEINFEFFLKTVHPDDVASVKKQLTDHLEGATSMYSAQYRLVTKSGELRHVMGRGRIVKHDAGGRPAKMSGIVTDVTDLKRLNDEVNRINSLESIGLLAGGLAHDFNNVLNIIYGNISFAKMLVGSDPAITESLADAEEACERAKELGIRLQALAQGTTPVKVPITLAAIIADAAAIAFKDSDVSHTICAADDVLPVEADPRQIRQVFENLLTNAKAAMSNDGKITIDIDNYLSDGKEEPPLESGSYVRIRLRDDGKGIPEQNLGKIFDPYFSTKDTFSQRGLGLGLSTCHAILKRHRGHISVESDVGIGTRITLYVPASEAVPLSPVVSFGITRKGAMKTAQQLLATIGNCDN